MMLLSLLAAQALPMTPLPTAMEPAMDRYSRCIFGRFNPGPSGAEKALRKCIGARRIAVEEAEDALAATPDFTQPELRRAFVRERFAGLEALFRETASGRLDPDDWE